MDNSQAIKIVDRLKNSFVSFDSKDKVGFLKEFHAFLLTLSYEKANKATTIIIQTKKYFPAIAEFLEAYKDSTAALQVNYDSVEDCSICYGNGFLPYVKIIDAIPYEFISYCECANGNRFKISTNKYYVPNYKEVIPADWLQNRKKDDTKINPKEIMRDIQQFLKRFKRLTQ